MRETRTKLYFLATSPTRLSGDVRADAAQNIVDAAPKVNERCDADDRNKHEDQGVLGQTLSFFLRLQEIYQNVKPFDELSHHMPSRFSLSYNNIRIPNATTQMESISFLPLSSPPPLVEIYSFVTWHYTISVPTSSDWPRQLKIFYRTRKIIVFFSRKTNGICFTLIYGIYFQILAIKNTTIGEIFSYTHKCISALASRNSLFSTILYAGTDIEGLFSRKMSGERKCYMEAQRHQILLIKSKIRHTPHPE